MRALLPQEVPLVEFLVSLAGLQVHVGDLRATPMDDGGMGSLRFASRTPDPHFGAEVAEAEFFDDDGVLVSATLNVDQNGHLFEVDVWKVNSSPLRKWPEKEHLHDARAN